MDLTVDIYFKMYSGYVHTWTKPYAWKWNDCCQTSAEFSFHPVTLKVNTQNTHTLHIFAPRLDTKIINSFQLQEPAPAVLWRETHPYLWIQNGWSGSFGSCLQQFLQIARLRNTTSIFRWELCAISLAMDLIHLSKDKDFVIFSDSTSSLQALSGFKLVPKLC